MIVIIHSVYTYFIINTITQYLHLNYRQKPIQIIHTYNKCNIIFYKTILYILRPFSMNNSKNNVVVMYDPVLNQSNVSIHCAKD